jgi:hypothetical protein
MICYLFFHLYNLAVKPSENVRATGYAPRSIPRNDQFPAKELTSGLYPPYFVMTKRLDTKRFTFKALKHLILSTFTA